MTTFVDEIMSDIDWRISELASIKMIPIKYNFNNDHKNIHIKYSVPAIYSIWEGFIKSCFVIYSNHLNTLSIKRTDIAVPLLTHQLDSECDFNNSRTNFDAKQKLVLLMDGLFNDVIVIKPSVPTESNVNYKVLTKILERFCIDPIDESYDKGLNKLLRFRNIIAHGENSITVDIAHIIEFVALVENLMLDILINIEKCEKAKSYHK